VYDKLLKPRQSFRITLYRAYSSKLNIAAQKAGETNVNSFSKYVHPIDLHNVGNLAGLGSLFVHPKVYNLKDI